MKRFPAHLRYKCGKGSAGTECSDAELIVTVCECGGVLEGVWVGVCVGVYARVRVCACVCECVCVYVCVCAVACVRVEGVCRVCKH